MVTATGYRPWHDAWTAASYGPGGFYRRHQPGQHFRTSAHVDPTVIARACLTLVDRHGLTAVTEVGAGEGQVLGELHRLRPGLALTGVDLRGRPDGVPQDVRWLEQTPERLTGLVLAHELLDNVPCDVVERDDSGVVRTVDVDADGRERLGCPVTDDAAAWLGRWWPLDRPGDRAEVGLTREAVWRDLVARTSGVAVAVDYGHVRGARPAGGTLCAFRGGRQVAPAPAPDRDLTAHVAMDALQAVAGGTLVRQREALADLAPAEARPAQARPAPASPAAELQALAAATRRSRLTDPAALGGFWWLATPCSGPVAGGS